MIKSSSEPALRAGSERGVFQNFSRGGFREFSILGGVLEYPPLAIPVYIAIHMRYNCPWIVTFSRYLLNIYTHWLTIELNAKPTIEFIRQIFDMNFIA